MKEEFIMFLEQREIKDKFETYVKQAYAGRSLDDYLEGTPPQSYVMGAFSWEDVPEGGFFWDEIDDEWKKYLEESRGERNHQGG